MTGTDNAEKLEALIEEVLINPQTLLDLIVEAYIQGARDGPCADSWAYAGALDFTATTRPARPSPPTVAPEVVERVVMKEERDVAQRAWELCDGTEGTVFTDEFGEHYRVPKQLWDDLAEAVARHDMAGWDSFLPSELPKPVVLREAVDALVNGFAWSAVTADCDEARDNLNGKIQAVRQALLQAVEGVEP